MSVTDFAPDHNRYAARLRTAVPFVPRCFRTCEFAFEYRHVYARNRNDFVILELCLVVLTKHLNNRDSLVKHNALSIFYSLADAGIPPVYFPSLEEFT